MFLSARTGTPKARHRRVSEENKYFILGNKLRFRFADYQIRLESVENYDHSSRVQCFIFLCKRLGKIEDSTFVCLRSFDLLF
jgi:hypothetical protein